MVWSCILVVGLRVSGFQPLWVLGTLVETMVATLPVVKLQSVTPLDLKDDQKTVKSIFGLLRALPYKTLMFCSIPVENPCSMYLPNPLDHLPWLDPLQHPCATHLILLKLFWVVAISLLFNDLSC